MKQRTLDEMVSYFNRQVSEMDIDQSYKIQLLGMVSAIAYGVQKPQLIPCSERLPDIKEHHVSEPCIVYCSNGAYGFAELEENIFGQVGWNCERDDDYHEQLGEVIAWMPLPEPWRGEEHGID